MTMRWQLESNEAELWLFKGDALGSLERYEEALQTSERALALDPTDPMAWQLKAATLAVLDRPWRSALAPMSEPWRLIRRKRSAGQGKVMP